MSQKEQTSDLHLETFHHLTGIPFNHDIGARANKENVLDAMGFSKGTNIANRMSFHLPETEINNGTVETHITEQIAQGRFVSMLFKGGELESMGGAPVTYIMSTEDVKEKLSFENGVLTKAVAHNGEVVPIDHEINLQTFSRRKSISSKISGFNNYDSDVSVKLGGGFRLQVDTISEVDGTPCLIISGCFSFNDMGSRVLELSCKQDFSIPRYETTFPVKIVNGNLDFSEFQNPDSLIPTDKVDSVIHQVISRLFAKDGNAINNLIKSLMSLRPSVRTHQLEGIFSIPSPTEISAEVIDFDGIDIFDMEGNSQTLSPSERLAKGQLEAAGFLITNPEDSLSYASFKKRIQEKTTEIINSDSLSEQVKTRLLQHISGTMQIFTSEQTGEVKLGQLSKMLRVDWEETDNSSLKKYKKGNDVLTLISVEGYDLVFWENEDSLVDCTDIKSFVPRLEGIFNEQILQVHLSSLREGD